MGDRQDGTEPMSPEVAVMVLQSELEHSPTMVANAVAALANLVDSAMPDGPYQDATTSNGVPECWHFVGYRPAAAELGQHSPDTLNAAELPQYQGVVFADGTCALRWLTAKRSWSVWDSFADMFDVHGHPEYGTEIHWPDGAPAEARNVIEAAAQDYRDRVAAEAAQAARDAVIATELPGAVASSPNGWVVSSLADLTEEQKAELLATPGALRWNGTHFENVEPIELPGTDRPVPRPGATW